MEGTQKYESYGLWGKENICIFASKRNAYAMAGLCSGSTDMCTVGL